jgi:hypothetical protein
MKSLEKAILARALGFAKLVSLPHKFSSYFIKMIRIYSGSLLKLQKILTVIA